jgi:hypothetical protein
LAPWGGWIGGAGGWFLTHQVGSDVALGNCSAAAPLTMAAIGLAGAALVALGGISSYGMWRRTSADHSRKTAAFLGATGMGAAALFFLAIIFQTGSALIIPRCFA